MERDVSFIFEEEIRDHARRYHLEFLDPRKKRKPSECRANEMERRKERPTPIVVGKSEGRGFNKEGGTARSVGSNFHFFHLFAPLTVILKKYHGGTSSRLVDFRAVFSSIGSPPLVELILSGLSFSHSFPSFPISRASLSNTYGPFCSLAESPLSFSRYIPSRTDSFPLQQPLRHFWARQESLCN